MLSAPSNIQIWTLVAAIFAAVTGPSATFMTARWVTKRRERTLLVLSLHWKWFGPDEQISEAALLHVENRSEHTIFVNEVRYHWGLFWRTKRHSYTALWMEDPSDVDFPYEVGAGQSRSFMLDEDDPISIYRRLEARYGWLFNLFHRFPVRIVVETTDGRRVGISALDAMRWASRPKWAAGDE